MYIWVFSSLSLTESHTHRHKSVFRSTSPFPRAWNIWNRSLLTITTTHTRSVSLLKIKSLLREDSAQHLQEERKDVFQELRAQWYGKIWVREFWGDQRWCTTRVKRTRYLLQRVTRDPCFETLQWLWPPLLTPLGQLSGFYLRKAHNKKGYSDVIYIVVVMFRLLINI